MVNEEVIRLVLETKGTETIALLDKSTKNYHASLEALTVQYAKDEITAESFRKQLERLGKEYEKQKELLYALDAATKTTTATTQQAGAAMAATQASTINSGRALQEFGIVANELAQGRIRGLSQSVGRLGAALGLGAGLAGTIGLVVTAGVEIIHMMGGWEKIMDALGLSAEKTYTRIEALHEKIKKLEENPHKVFMEINQLEEARNEAERIEKALKTIDELRKSQEHYEAESGKGVKALLASDPEAMKALTKNVVANLTATDPGLAEAQAREAEARRRLAIDPEELEKATFRAVEAYEKGEKPAEARGRIGKQADVFRGETINRAVSGKGEEQAKAQELLREGFKNAGKQLLVEGLEAVTPASLFQQDVVSEEAEGLEGEMHTAVGKRKKRDQRIDALNAQGIANENAAAAARDRDKKQTGAAEDARLGRGVADINRQVTEQIGLISKGSLDERAVAMAAQLRAGGARDPQGSLQQRISGQLQQDRPDLNPIQRSMVAGKMAQQAMQKADAAMGEARMEVGQMMPAINGNLSATEKMQRAAAINQQSSMMVLQRANAAVQQADLAIREAVKFQHAVTNQKSGSGMN